MGSSQLSPPDIWVCDLRDIPEPPDSGYLHLHVLHRACVWDLVTFNKH